MQGHDLRRSTLDFLTKKRRFRLAMTAADEAPKPLFISSPEGQLRHTRKDASARDDGTQDRGGLGELRTALGLVSISLAGHKRLS
jgi:hypothetical protein